MTIQQILGFIAAVVIIHLVGKEKWRTPALGVLSILGIYILQPASPIRYLDFWLPTAALGITVVVWGALHTREGFHFRQNLAGFGVVVISVLLIALLRYLNLDRFLLPSTPPQIWQVGVGMLLVLGLAAFSIRFRSRSFLLGACIGLLLALFLVVKTSLLTGLASTWLRSLNGQAVDLASPLDIRWLGYSYLAFRLIHVLRDRQTGRFPASTFLEFLVYAIFIPAYTAGPIDRLERFLKDLRRPYGDRQADFLEGGKRLAVGLFKKFVLADSLALIAINQVNIPQINQVGWLWALLFAYSFQIYLDFSGYTDIAVGMSRIVGFNLPENFNQPYLKPNLTLFWNNWHMTLTQWFRAYYFNPLARWLRSGSKPASQSVVILLGQVSTMLLIGLWHGVAWNFVIWGIWHGLGLFLQNRWSEWAKRWMPDHLPGWLKNGPGKKGLELAGVLATFLYVSLGWLWFAVADPAVSSLAFSRLLGGAW